MHQTGGGGQKTGKKHCFLLVTCGLTCYYQAWRCLPDGKAVGGQHPPLESKAPQPDKSICAWRRAQSPTGGGSMGVGTSFRFFCPSLSLFRFFLGPSSFPASLASWRSSAFLFFFFLSSFFPATSFLSELLALGAFFRKG